MKTECTLLFTYDFVEIRIKLCMNLYNRIRKRNKIKQSQQKVRHWPGRNVRWTAATSSISTSTPSTRQSARNLAPTGKRKIIKSIYYIKKAFFVFSFSFVLNSSTLDFKFLNCITKFLLIVRVENINLIKVDRQNIWEKILYVYLYIYI